MKDAISQYGRIILTLIVILSLLGIIFGGIWFSRLRDTSDNLMKDPVSEEFVQRAAPTLYVQDQAAIVGRSFYIKGLVSALDADGVDISQYITITSEDGLYDSVSGMFLSNKPGKYTLIVSVSDPRAEEFSLSLTTTKKMIVTVNNTLDRYSINAKTEPHGLLAFNTTSAKEGTIIKIIPTPDVGYKFDGCKIEYEVEKTKEELAADGSNRYKKVEIELTTDNLQFTMPAADVLVTPKWSAIDVTVIFNGNGGKITGDDILTKKYGETYGGMPTVTKAGYVFEGWYTNKEGGILISDTTRVLNTSTHTLFAHWTVAEYTIKYKSDSTILSEQKVKFGSRIGSMPIPTKNGFVFSEWVLETDESKVFTAKTKYTLTSDITLIAKWTPSSGVIKFNPNGGTLSTDSKIIKYGQPYGEFPIPTLKGYNFLGWYTAIEGGNKVEETDVVLSVDTKTLYAHWELAKYKITFNAAGGIPATQTLSNNITYNSTLDLSSIQTPTYENRDFLGWFTSGVGGVPISTGSIFEYSSDITLYAHWTTKPITIRLHYCDEENTIVERKFYLGEKYGSQLNVFSRSGLDVRAWYTEYDETTKTYSGTQITKDTIVNDDGITDLYAHWSAKNITINFMQSPIPRFADAYAELPEPITVEYGESFNIYELVKPAKSMNYVFDGWCVYDASCDTYGLNHWIGYDETCNFDTDITLFPCFMESSKIYFDNAESAMAVANLRGLRSYVGEITVNGKTLYCILDACGELFRSDFSNNPHIIRVEFSNTHTAIRDSVFKDCTNLTDIIFPENQNIREIGASAFENTGIKNLFIPKEIEIIGDSAFKNTNLETITFEDRTTSSIKKAKLLEDYGEIPKGAIVDILTTIREFGSLAEVDGDDSTLDDVFYEEKIIKYSDGDNIYFDDISNNETVSECIEILEGDYDYTPPLYIGDSAFARELPTGDNGLNTPVIQNLIFPKELCSIGDNAFALIGPSLNSSAGYINYLEFPENSQLTHIGNNAFLNALSKNVTHILNFDTCCRGIQNIGSSAFENCNIFGIVFPDPENDSDEIIKSSNTIVVGDNAFRNNPLSEHTVDNPLLISPAIKTLSAKCFENCGMEAVIVSDSVEECEEDVFKGCNSLVNITIPCVYGDCFSYLFGASKYEENPTYVPSSLKSVTLSDKCTEIPDWAFYRCENITSATIGDGATSIGDYAFWYCRSLTSVTIGNGVTEIGTYAFEWCDSLTSVTMGNSVTTIGSHAFGVCGFTSIEIPDSVTSIGDFAFHGCSSLTSITIPDSVTSIGKSAFEYCYGLTSATIGNGVTNIGDYAFRCCPVIKIITIGDGLTTVGLGVFSDCNKLARVTIPCVYGDCFGYLFGASKYEENPTYVPSSLWSVTLSDKCTEIPDWAFYRCDNIMSVTIGDGVTSIGDYAFSRCSGLTSVAIGNGVTSIGEEAFLFCDSLTSITLPNSVTSIGYGAFCGCGFTSVTIPDSVTSIGEGIFQSCRSLASVTIPDSITSIGGIAFAGCSNLTSIEIPESVMSIGYRTFYDCSSLTSVIIPNSVTSIGKDAFSGTAYYNKTANWENSVLYIGDYLIKAKTSLSGAYTVKNGTKCIADGAFSDCNKLTSINVAADNNYYSSQDGVLFNKDKTELIRCPGAKTGAYTIPNSVTSIGNDAFYNCSNLKSVTIPDSVTSIGDYAFYDCSSLTSITIPDSVTSIGSHAFAGCDNLASVTIGNSVTNIGDYAFYGCSGLTSIEIPSSVTSIENYAFYGCSSLTSVTIPDSVTSIGKDAFFGTAYYQKTANWENSVLYIGNYLIKARTSLSGAYTVKNGTKCIAGGAFEDCSSLTSVTIPDSVTSIGHETFYNCSSLTSVTIPNSVTTIGEDVFKDCNANLTIKCHNGSEIYKYAVTNSIKTDTSGT